MHAIDDTTMVSRLIRRGPVTVTPDATLRTVCEILLREEVGVALVVSDGETIGLVSERDVVTALADGADVDGERVEDVMVFEAVTVDPHDTLKVAAALMVDGGIRHLLVGDRHAPVGVISMRDVVAACLESA